MIIWLDGALVPLEDARISPLDHGLTVGDGVFETMRVYDGVPFAWRRHLERLAASAAGLGLELPDVAALRTAAADVHRRERLARRAPSAHRHRRPRASGIVASFRRPARRVPRRDTDRTVDTDGRRRGGALDAQRARRDRRAEDDLLRRQRRAPSPTRRNGARARRSSRTHAATCARRRVRTCSSCATARSSRRRQPAGCLLGVTRGLLLELAEDCKEADVSIDALATADEAFLSSTTREVQPIAHVDGVALPAAPGPVATALAAAFRALVARDIDP